ncbi:sensor histidine kinase [Hyunsoonleella sp. SJ7]|uniref:histidine kinase n=1 Tax=Hyunsoonleella aquatilis TaxID=2762758 RepID=A0A923KLX9_9FLAO|nr:tetratricopeptide repeat protein [Hyunsoonleella aquatilis]MBC3759248.1 sensor histidine kinase [Hyunsoonleella aquatilis]
MKFQLAYVFLLLYSICFGQSQDAYLDSLKTVISSKKSSDFNRALAHSKLAWANLSKDVKTAETHLDSAMALYSKLKNEEGISASNYRYAVLSRVVGNYEQAHNYIDKYRRFVEKQKDTFKIANGLYQKGVIYSLENNYEASLKAYLKTLSIYEQLKDSTGMGFTLNSIGIVYKNLEKYDEAIASYNQAVAIHEAKSDLDNLANVYNGIGSVYAEQGNLDRALEYYEKTLSIDKQIENEWGTAQVSRNIGAILIEKEQFQNALGYLNQAYNIQQTHDYISDIPETLSLLSKAYMHLRDFSKSRTLLKQAFAMDVPSKKVFRDLHWQSYQLNNSSGNVEEALHHFITYTSYKDSILNEDNLKNINRLEIQFETEKKDKALVEQQLAIEKNQARFKYMTGIAIFLLIVSIMTFVVFRQRQKRKAQEILALKREGQIKTLEALIEGEENERYRIARELHDGVNGDLSAIKYKLSALMETNQKVIAEAITMIDESCKQVRAISHNLVPPSLKNFNLVEAIADYCNNLNNINPKEEIIFQHLGEAVELPQKAEVNVFRIIQELVTNSLKHAEAKTINVQLSLRDNTLQITVEDDGKGFDKDKVDSDGIGLSNVQSRIDYLKAEVDFVSNENGTSYIIEIDLEKLNDN